MAAHSILVLSGDGVGPEITAEALKVLTTVSSASGVTFDIKHGLCGGCSIDAHGVPVTDEVVALAKASGAVLFAAAGGPKWGAGAVRPEEGLLRLRKELNAFANLRPCKFASQSLTHLSVIKEEFITGTDFMLVRENCGGAYFGTKVEDEDYACDPWQYSRAEIERVARVAGELAMLGGPRRVISCDKANVLASSRLWRRVVTELFAREFKEVELSHQLADSAAMLMVKDPRSFNGVVLMDNTFGDILSDVSSVIPGSLGLLPSASLSGLDGKAQGIYEPIHGSAPDIAGKGIVNPVAMILSVAMMLKYSFGMNKEADSIDQAVAKVLDSKDIGGMEIRTGDLRGKAGTVEIGEAIRHALAEILKVNGV